MSIEATTTKVKELAASSDPLGSSVKFVFNGGEGSVYLDGKGEENTVSNEDKEADCTVNIDLEDFNALMSGDLDPMGAFMGGKLRIDGDMGVAMKLSSLFG